MKIFSTISFLVIAIAGSAQYEVGHLSTSFYDASRDRDVTCEIYYPADVAGDNVDVSTGSFPVIVFGHGFFMPWDDYSNIWNFLVPQGYIMTFATTGGEAFPDHEAFGLDLAFLVESMVAEGADAVSDFYQRLNGREALMGHSMGGGCSWLAAAEIDGLDCVVGLAPAETSPSAIGAASSVNVPALVISGSSDEVTPPTDHHLPMYTSTATTNCKAYVSIIEGGHCGYADDGTICDLGEFLFAGMSREEQQEITHNLLQYWLGYYLKNQQDANDAFEAYCNDNTSLDWQTNCVISDVEWLTASELEIFPNPADNFARITYPDWA
ncbi:MAG: hypothetical protein RL220_2088, partial [Bacteroidota bacterium]